MSFRDWVDRCIPQKASWSWVWKIEQRVFGNRKPVLIQANIVSFDDPPPTLLSNLVPASPNFTDTNGLSVWLLSSNQLSALRRDFKQTPGVRILQAPRMFSAEGIEATMFVGASFPPFGVVRLSGAPPGSTMPATPGGRAGTEFSCCVRFRRNSTDFLTRVTVSELVTKDNDAIDTNGYGPYGYAPPTITMPQTNLDTALRLQLPKGNGVFLLDQSHHQPPRKNIGVLIDPL